MQYHDEVPNDQQISMDQFYLLPLDPVTLRYEGKDRLGLVREVGSANPEYVLHGPQAPDAGVVRWSWASLSERLACESFIKSGHPPTMLRLKRSMWAVVELIKPLGDPETGMTILTIILYTYEIEELRKNGFLKKGFFAQPLINAQ